MSENNSRNGGFRRGTGRVPKCRRNLFGRSDDNGDLEKEVAQMQKEQALKFSEKWNFDPQKQTPLNGKYEWTLVGTVSSTEGGLLSLPDKSPETFGSNQRLDPSLDDVSDELSSSFLKKNSSLSIDNLSQDSNLISSKNSSLLDCVAKRKKLDDENDTDNENGRNDTGSSKNPPL